MKMKCPFCSKEIKDDALFCGFCGKQIPQKPRESASPAPPVEEKEDGGKDTLKNDITQSDTTIDTVPTEETQEKKKARDKNKKKHTALKVLLVFVLIAFISGGLLGFLTARGVISLDTLKPKNHFKWTNFTDGETEIVETLDDAEGKEDEKSNSDESSATEDQTEETHPTETPEPSPESSSEESQPPSEVDEHYAEFTGDSLVVVDDKAHIWESTTIESILENAKAMSELSDYSIMIVITNDMFGMTSQEFSDDYYDYVLAEHEGNTDLLADGYIFLINLADREYYLSTSGTAINVYTDAAMSELFNSIQQAMVDGDYETAVNTIIEKTIY